MLSRCIMIPEDIIMLWDNLKINAETSDLHPIVMCTSKSENVHPFFSIRHRSHQDTSLVTKLQRENTGVLS